MTSAPAIHDPRPDTHDAPEGSSSSPGARIAVLALALEWASFCGVMGVYGVFRASHPEVRRAGLGFFSPGWGLAQLAVVLLGGLMAWRLVPALRARQYASAMTLSAIVALYGLAALGLMGVEWGRWGGPHIIVVAPSADGGERRSASPVAAAVAKADPQAGARAFASTCAACHGPTGEGIVSIAPALKTIPFISQSNDAQIAAVVTNGRAPDDPATKTGKLMPPRGGNPFLSDGDVANIVAFLKAAAGGTPPAVGGASSPVTALAPRWVVPPPTAGPQGLSEAFGPRLQNSPLPAELRLQQPSSAERTFAPVAAAMSAVYALHLLIGIAVMAALLWQSYLLPLAGSGLLLARFARAYWLAAVAMWLVLFPLLYVL